jgi:type I restriction enzyme, S subunit
MSGLDLETEKKIKEVFSSFDEIDKVILYGSRSKGNYKIGSDIDLTLYGKNLKLQIIYKIQDKLDELYLPYKFDLSIYAHLDNLELKESINNSGVVFYQKKYGLPKGWEMKKLLDVVDFQRGLTYSKSDEVEFSDNIVLRSNNVDLKTNKLDFTELKYINPKVVIPTNKKVTRGSLIICTANGSKSHLGKVALIDDDYDYAFGGFMGLIKPKENLNSDFLFHLMTSEAYKKFIGALSDGANINNLKFSDLGEFKIPLPPLKEQQRIVSILDECFSAITKAKANAQQNLKNAKELFESYLQGVFENKGEDWEEKTLGEITTHLGDGLHGTPKYTVDGDYYFINGNNLTDGVIEFKESTKKVSIEEYKKYKKNLTDRTILVSINGTLGNVAFYNDEKIILGKSACYFNLKESIDKNFILYILSSPYFLNYAHKEATGATIKNVSLKTMREFLVPFPPLKEQKSIVQKLDALSAETKRLEAIYQKKINDLEELKKSILQKAFSGCLLARV